MVTHTFLTRWLTDTDFDIFVISHIAAPTALSSFDLSLIPAVKSIFIRVHFVSDSPKSIKDNMKYTAEFGLTTIYSVKDNKVIIIIWFWLMNLYLKFWA